MNQVERRTVSSAPVALTASSARWASGSPRPESSTILGTPRLTAISAKERVASTAPGTARSG
jgi:hypothetical protein